ncbi:exported hypothetical protein [Candidatus Zixiibacteriota bacterium]|nr:exported hypothetical protein [candidate division Zixibacteria bacterium]
MKKFAIIALICLLAPAVGFSQGNANRLVPAATDSTRPLRPGTALPLDKIVGVRQMMAQGAYVSAALLLEGYIKDDPDNYIIVDLLLNCYDELKLYDKSITLLKNRIEKNPGDIRSQYLLLEVYLKSGSDTLAADQVNYIMAANKGNKDIYGTVIQLLVKYGRTALAQSLIEKGRKEFNHPEFFAVESAAILETKGAYYDAVMEYFKVPRSDTLRFAQVERSLAELIRYPGAPPDVIRAFNDILKKSPDDPLALRMLGEAYVFNNQYPEAFEVNVRLDSISNMQGQLLFQYMRQCRERKLYEQVIKASEYIERRYPQNTIISEYKFYNAEALAGLGKFQEALTQYEKIIAQAPQQRDKAEALLGAAGIYRYDLRRYDTARRLYDSVVTAFPFAAWRFTAALEIAKLLVVEGKLDSAQAAFTALQNDRMRPENREIIDYNLALILFYRRQYDDANTAFRKVMAQYPRGYYLNDALINSLLISENSGTAGGALDLYAGALFYEARLMPDSVEKSLHAVIDMGETPLVGQAGYKLAGFYLGQADTAGAMNVIERMEKNYGTNYYFPYCLKLKGDILAQSAEHKNEAAEIYKSILEKYGNYPFIGEVRKSLQELEKYRLPG